MPRGHGRGEEHIDGIGDDRCAKHRDGDEGIELQVRDGVNVHADPSVALLSVTLRWPQSGPRRATA